MATPPMGILFLLLVLAVGGPIAVVGVRALTGPVPRRRVEEFARLHRLTVTAGNGNQIIAYRATTRRWRTFGLTASIAVQLVAVGGVTVFTWAFAGWFAGAVVAEVRVAQLARGPRASAFLVPRKNSDYLPRLGRWAAPGALALCVLTAVAGLAFGGSDGADVGALGLWTLFGVAIGVATLAAQRRVLRRPQPHAEPDRIAADDAIRSRSLHVLAGSGMVLVFYCVLEQLTASHLAVGKNAGVIAFFALGGPFLGRILAYWPWSPKRPGTAGPAATGDVGPA